MTTQKGEREEALSLIVEMREYHADMVELDGGGEARCWAMYREAADTIERLLSASKAEGEMLKRAKASLDIRLNDHLCEMKEGYDDSIVGFNEAWDVVRAFFDERLVATRPSQLPLKDTTNE